MRTLLRKIFETLVVKPISRWVVRSVGMCGVGSPPDAESHSEHGSRELVVLVHSRFTPQPLASLSPRWKGWANTHRWKQKQLLIMLCTIWRVRGFTVWEFDLFIELLKIRKTQDIEMAALYAVIQKSAPKSQETFYSYRDRVGKSDPEDFWFLGRLFNGPGSPLRSSHPCRVAGMAKSYLYLCKWIVNPNLPATQFRTVEKRRKRGYTDHGSLGSRSYATKRLDEELAQLHYDNWPPWRKAVALMGHEGFLRWCYQEALI